MDQADEWAIAEHLRAVLRLASESENVDTARVNDLVEELKGVLHVRIGTSE
jgi:hypothetical protein